MSALMSLIAQIPDVVWSGVIASVLTLSGVLIANWSNTNRLKLQLRHDATEKQKERTSALRREVYLRATEELTKANTYLASLPQANLAKTNVADGLQGFFAAAAKLQLVAEPATALLVNRLVGEYGELLLRLLTRLMPLHEARNDIELADHYYNEAQGQVSRILSEMRKFNETAQIDASVFRALDASFEMHQTQANRYSEERDEHWAKYNRLNAEFIRTLLPEMQRLGELQIPVLVEIRRDLGLTSDLAAYQEQMKQQWLRMSHQLNAMLDTLKDG